MRRITNIFLMEEVSKQYVCRTPVKALKMSVGGRNAQMPFIIQLQLGHSLADEKTKTEHVLYVFFSNTALNWKTCISYVSFVKLPTITV